jgi:nucleoside phosphorylase
MRRLSHEEYKVGWVCALPVELAAALEMLDEEHEDLQGGDNDENLYSLGSIAGHNVVIVCLPAGRIGNNPAAAVAMQMRATFQEIRFGLMVGIGGGVPSAEADIRLGDVVVSQPHQTFGGVVQYDVGKTTPSGFTRTGSLNSPPQILLAAVARVRANELRGRSKLSESISKIGRIPKFQRKNAGPDVLFKAEYDHEGGYTCNECKIDRQEARDLRDSEGEVVVHYGTIASGNQVIKDGRTRDRLSRELAGILCFEMEAAGLMNSFPCLAIRGICDYADSHKSKKWQPYAAATAAAYAKEVLSTITPTDVARTRTADEAIQSIHPKLDVVNKKTDKLLLKIELPIATGASFNSHTEEHNARCLPNTRTELLETIAEWANNTDGKGIFWLCGMAGTGKSTIARTAAQSFAKTGQLGASFFFKKGEGERGNASRFFSTIATDLVACEPGMLPGISKALDKDPALSQRALRDQCEKLILHPLSEIQHSATRTWVVVIDALDECEMEEDIRAILQLLARAKDTRPVSLRVLVTSRPELHIRLGFKRMPNGTYQDLVLHQVAKNTIEHDIRLFYEHELSAIRQERGLSLFWPTSDQIQALVDLAVPLFIFAATVCRYIGTKGGHPEGYLSKVLGYEKSTFSQLDRTYLPILEQLLVEQEEDEKEAWLQAFRKLVGSIVVLESPLSITSLSRLLQIPQTELECRLDPLHSVLSVPDTVDVPVRLLHLSFRDFLIDCQRRDKSQFWVDARESHKNLASYCLKLMSKGLRQNICSLSAPGTIRSEIDEGTIASCLSPEVQYACRYWVSHLKQSWQEIADGDMTHTFLKEHLLHWFEAMSLIRESSKCIYLLGDIHALVAVRSLLKKLLSPMLMCNSPQQA